MLPDRRTSLGAWFGVTAAVASRSNGLMTAARAHPGSSPPTTGDLSCDPGVRGAAAQDFGRLVHKQPRAVFRPTSSADIASLMRWAGSRGLKVAARGQGHSICGRALTEDGIVIDMNSISSIGPVHQVRIGVEAGATGRNVRDPPLAKGLTPPRFA